MSGCKHCFPVKPCLLQPPGTNRGMMSIDIERMAKAGKPCPTAGYCPGRGPLRKSAKGSFEQRPQLRWRHIADDAEHEAWPAPAELHRILGDIGRSTSQSTPVSAIVGSDPAPNPAP